MIYPVDSIIHFSNNWDQDFNSKLAVVEKVAFEERCSTVVTKLMLHVNRGDAKLLFSAANDGTIIAWGSGGAVHDRIPVSF